MRKLLLVILILQIISIKANAQLGSKEFEGVVIDQKTNVPIAFVNIGIVNKNFGTVSGLQGKFRLCIPEKHLNDTLTFSRVGYQTLSIAIPELLTVKSHKIQLIEKATALKEVIVKAKRNRERKIGNKSHNPLLWGYIQNKTNRDIIEFCQLIKLKGITSNILSAHLYLNGVYGIDSCFVRVNFYECQNNKPGKRVLTRQILKKLALRKGWINIDLQDQAISLKDDFFIGYEFLPGHDKKGYSVYYGGKFGGKNGFSRSSSQGKWNKLHGASVSTYVKLQQ